ncbi:MAG: hypothetical protein PHQ88_01950 [Bacteroides sp.]|nr:hypothetical protein [Bacteroides sp.]MDD4054365.1 hypothetical protein [Bacteroides sp.]MDD4719610.1 hypothetical protein [Bacteroides sp.]NLI64799.1 hypothetical protein [Bacteroidales bacterium]
MSFNTHFPNKDKITLADISNRKKEVLLEIRKQQELITTHVQTAIQPVNSIVSSTQSYFRPFQLGFSAFSVLRLGWKSFKKIRKVLRRMF